MAGLRRTTSDGAAVAILELGGRRYVGTIRLLTLAPTIVVAVLAAWGTPMAATVIVVLAAVGAWSVVFWWQVRRTRRTWIVIPDTAVLALLALSAQLVVPPSWVGTGKSWLLPFVSFSCVAAQLYTGALAGAMVAVALSAAMLVGTVRALPPGGSSASIVTSAWVLVLSVMARILWMLIRRGGQIADEFSADVEAARRERSVASAIRADERALANALHDTAAATLLMVGMGQTGPHRTTLARRAQRDIDVLRSYGYWLPRRADAARLLDKAMSVVPLPIGYDGVASLWLPAAVARAVVDAAAEALNNVVKHAQVDAVHVGLSGQSGKGQSAAVCLVVTDDGVGFDPVAAHPTGRGVRESMVGRMTAVGGTCTIDSAAGRGTVVTLEWADV